ncbi:4-hydroxyphenylpyruvate dioxygenase [Plakobranchus ocellatus]|uniref:4-hydroxyphenylpyruvate dioxygenase n=1 Tax=Plakobranchus ocellatus TaxID=259542 RepID=A0AAV4DV18_9GAST|nr:4-hydroxyphenylpyruvate dioxygenase [Plakobranchus ocellatus]
MPSFACVHHIEIGTTDGPGTVDVLKNRFTFTLRATRFTPVADQWLLVKKNTRFLVTCLKCGDKERIQKDEYVINWALDTSPASSNCSKLPHKDSVFNVSFEVKDLDASLHRLRDQGVTVSKQPRTVADKEGCVRSVVVKSCVGDIHHTLIDKRDYNGFFLPGFTPVDEVESIKGISLKSDRPKLDSALETFDHVALAVQMDTSTEVIGWYERCFGMKRFLINSDEDKNQGLVLSNKNVGLRLRAMEYWKCAEVGLVAPGEGTESRLSMVIAEGLPPFPGSSEENQIESWMRQHGGPGIQHVAITSSDIKVTVPNLKLYGAQFASPPPPAYYSEAGRLQDIIMAGEDVEALRAHGILIDTEADGIHSLSQNSTNVNSEPKDSYLLQVFTKPMLKSDPFFMEIIQREGASGFGSGNITALYRSVQASIVNEQRQP